MAEPMLAGAVDLHIHTAPDLFPRNVTAITAAEAAKAAGMGAIVVKSHSTDTAARAETAREAVGFPVYGGVALNYSVGGLNPYAVRETAKQGGRIVWMPTIGARHFIRNSVGVGFLAQAIPPGVEGLTILDENDGLRATVLDVLDEVIDNDLLLASGHLEPRETRALFAEAMKRGAKRLLVTHPHVPFVHMGHKDQLALAELGAYIEITDHESIDERLKVIETAGAARCVLSTDGGTVEAPTPVERLTKFVRALSEAGISDDDLHTMTVVNPGYLLRVDEESA
jgi:Family of unknown function (DUF6282)